MDIILDIYNCKYDYSYTDRFKMVIPWYLLTRCADDDDEEQQKNQQQKNKKNE